MPRKLLRFLDFIYPASCHLCECPLRYGKHLCRSCQDSLPSVQPPFCCRCGDCYEGEISEISCCPNCHDLNLDFEFARAALRNTGGARTLLHDYKYQRKIHLTNDLGELLLTGLADPRFIPYRANGLLIPVPLHPTRLRKRKFNQSEEMAARLAKLIGLPMKKALKRSRQTLTQTRLGRSVRLKNLHGAFQPVANCKTMIADKNIILIDDVFTTGSTVNECTRVLIENGAPRVAVLTLLRG